MWRLAQASRRGLAGQRALSSAPNFQVGSVVHGFEVLKKQTVPEYSITAIQLQHQATKAEYIHVDTVDTNNVFSINFRTPPYSSNGIAHILEHLVLCGSKQFPVRDPFFNMLKRSLNNFMNAMTANDHTMYPFATTNAKDFTNLMHVYLDAVFFPNLDRLDFSQEGHRIELDEHDKLVFKGVVLNEMKGVLSDSQTLFMTRLQQELMRGSVYEHVSGGDPADLTSLTYEELKAFHGAKYHPSNCLFYSYGHFPLADHLETVATRVLSHFTADNANPPPQPTIIQSLGTRPGPSGIRDIHLTGPDDGVSPTAAAQTKWCQSNIVPNVLTTDNYTCFVLRLLSYLLLHGASAPLYKALITSELAVDFAPGTGFDASTYNPTFGIGVEGFEMEQLDTIKGAIQSTLKQVVQDGFDDERIQALLHQIELSQKHIVGKFGMSLMRGLVQPWCHRGDDLIESLSINPILERFHKDMEANPRFLQDMLLEYIVKPHFESGVALLMTPSKTYVSELEAKERAKLDKIDATLTANDKIDLKQRAETLQAHQNQVPNIECLPTLTVHDIPTEQPRLDIEFHGDKMQFVPQTTNELTYVRLKFNVDHVPADLKWFLPLFSSMVGQLGTSKFAFDQLPTVLQNVCGGVSCAYLVSPDTHDVQQKYTEALMVETLCLPQHLDSTLGLVRDIFQDTQYSSQDNLPQIKTLLIGAAAAANASVASSGHSLASSRAQLGLTSHATLIECTRGLTSMEALQLWAQAVESDPSALELLGKLFFQLSVLCFQPNAMQASVVTEPHLISTVENHLDRMTWSLPTPMSPNEVKLNGGLLPSIPQALDKAFFGFPISVNFNVHAFQSVALFHHDHAPFTILAQVLSSCFLHQHVRERGGAYGCGASQGEGVFTMSSYFDPHTTRTFNAYKEAIEYAVNGGYSDRDVNEAILSTFSGLDAPQAPSAKGKGTFTRGFTHDQLQQRRLDLLQVTRTDLMRVANDNLLKNPTQHLAGVGKQENRDHMVAQGFQ
ncbi:unnamed protein product [Aphanomyces euteiches]